MALWSCRAAWEGKVSKALPPVLCLIKNTSCSAAADGALLPLLWRRPGEEGRVAGHGSHVEIRGE